MRQPGRSERGSYLVETLIAVVIGGILLLATYNTQTSCYRAGSTAQSQILASNMAQQIIDNARDCSYGHLHDDLLAGNLTVSQNIPLYSFPTNPATALFPRPLLRNPNLTYSGQAGHNVFNGTVTENLTNLTPGNTTDGLIRVDVSVQWNDTTGFHQYATGTTISQTGIHN